jgi:hypothetical protein
LPRRYSKHDGQLQKTLDQLMEGVVDYFAWQGKHRPAADIEALCFEHFVRFVDSIVVYFTQGVPNNLVTGILKVVKLQADHTRSRVCSAHKWRAENLAGSSSIWASAGASLRAALEAGSTSAEEAPGQGRQKRARI